MRCFESAKSAGVKPQRKNRVYSQTLSDKMEDETA